MTTINPSTPFFKWKMAIVTKTTDDWTLWNCDETYERTLFIGIHDDLEQPYAALYIIYKGTVQPAAGNAIIADLASMQLQINTALQELQALIDQVNATSGDMQELQAQMAGVLVDMEDKLEAMQEQIAKARVWAEGTDAEVTELGGQHSARTWAGIAKQAADLATGAAFPILEDGDQGKALVVNDTADGYIVEEISGGGGSGFGSAHVQYSNSSGNPYVFTDGSNRILVLPVGTEGLVPGQGFIVAGSLKLTNEVRITLTSGGTALYLAKDANGTIQVHSADQYTWWAGATKPSSAAFTYWTNTETGECWHLNAESNEDTVASAPIGLVAYSSDYGGYYFMPYVGFSMLPGAKHEDGYFYNYLLVSPTMQVQFPCGKSINGPDYITCSGITGALPFRADTDEHALGSNYDELLLQLNPATGSVSIVSTSGIAYNAELNAYTKYKTGSSFEALPYAVPICWLSHSYNMPLTCEGSEDRLNGGTFAQNVQNIQGSALSPFLPSNIVECLPFNEGPIGPAYRLRSTPGKIYIDKRGKMYQMDNDNRGYLTELPYVDKAANYTWTGQHTFENTSYFEGITCVPDFSEDATESQHKKEAVNAAMLDNAIATCEPLNTGVNLLPAASTWAFWQENDSSVTTLDKTTGIVSGCTKDAYPISAKTLTELGVPEDTKDAEIIMRFKMTRDSTGSVYLLKFADASPEQYGISGILITDDGPLIEYGPSGYNAQYEGSIVFNSWGYLKLSLVGGVPTFWYMDDASGVYTLETLPDSGWTQLGGNSYTYTSIVLSNLRIAVPYVRAGVEIDLRNTKLSFGNVTVWDGSTVASAPFDGILTKVGSVTLNDTTGIASNFGNGSYLQFVDGMPSADDGYDMIFRVMQNGSSGRGAILSKGSDSSTLEFGLQDTTPYSANASQTLMPVSPALSANQWNWVRFVRPTASGDFVTQVYVLPDPNESYTLDSLPDLSEWTLSSTTSEVAYTAGSPLYIGHSEADASYYFHGSIDLFNTRITVGNVYSAGRSTVFYDGAPLAPKDYQTQGIHSQSTGRIANGVILRRFEANSKVYMELDGTFEGVVASDSTITISTKDYGFKGTLISLQAMQMGTGATTVNYNSTTAADLVKGTLTLRTSLGAGEAYKVSVHCVIEQNG